MRPFYFFSNLAFCGNSAFLILLHCLFRLIKTYHCRSLVVHQNYSLLFLKFWPSAKQAPASLPRQDLHWKVVLRQNASFQCLMRRVSILSPLRRLRRQRSQPRPRLEVHRQSHFLDGQSKSMGLPTITFCLCDLASGLEWNSIDTFYTLLH